MIQVHNVMYNQLRTQDLKGGVLQFVAGRDAVPDLAGKAAVRGGGGGGGGGTPTFLFSPFKS